jgi:hypothetical protein
MPNTRMLNRALDGWVVEREATKIVRSVVMPNP